MSTVLFSSLKNEGPFIVEWVAFHLAVGFDRIVIASNDCDEGSEQVLQALHGAGVIEHIPNPLNGPVAPQLQAEERARKLGVFAKNDYVMWLDLDEFLVPPEGCHTVHDLVAEIEKRDVDGLCLNWRIMGDSGFDGLPSGFIEDRFTGASRAHYRFNRLVKTLFRYSDAIERLHLHRPIWTDAHQSKVRLIDGRGALLDDRFLTKRFRDGSPVGGHLQGRGSFELGRINHYAVRTRSLYALKKQRGRGFFKDAGQRDDRHTDDFFQRFNQNLVQNTDILRFRECCIERVSELMLNETVRAAHLKTVSHARHAISVLSPSDARAA